MVKVFGPLLSEAASGPLTADFNFSIARGRAYLRQNPSVVADSTLPQFVHRRMLAFLSPQWSLLSASARESWILHPSSVIRSPYHAYLQDNLRRWSRRAAPGQDYPVEQHGANTLIHTISATAGERSIALSYKRFFAPWGAIIYRDTGWPDPPKDLTIAIVFPNIQGVTTTWIDTDLAPGTYYYRVLPFNDDGKPGSLSAIVWDTVT